MLFTSRLILLFFVLVNKHATKTMHLQPTWHNKKYKKITQFVQMLRQGLSDQVLSDISRRACTTQRQVYYIRLTYLRTVHLLLRQDRTLYSLVSIFRMKKKSPFLLQSIYIEPLIDISSKVTILYYEYRIPLQSPNTGLQYRKHNYPTLRHFCT